MTKFIKLHEANRGNSMVLVNVDHIGAIQTGNTKDVYVRMHYSRNGSDGQQKTEYYFVKESFEEIELLLWKSDYVEQTK